VEAGGERVAAVAVRAREFLGLIDGDEDRRARPARRVAQLRPLGLERRRQRGRVGRLPPRVEQPVI
jgi:hypothetical protein